LLLRLTRLATLLLAANRKGSCNKARIRYYVVLAAGLSGFNAHRHEMASPET